MLHAYIYIYIYIYIYEKIYGVQGHRVILVWPYRALQFYRPENLYLPVHPVTGVALRTAIKETHCII
jgi:hypothetical protein